MGLSSARFATSSAVHVANHAQKVAEESIVNQSTPRHAYVHACMHLPSPRSVVYCHCDRFPMLVLDG